jgi:S-DNA-T family DNA segregation ATPase FtsK/SpoIIIE
MLVLAWLARHPWMLLVPGVLLAGWHLYGWPPVAWSAGAVLVGVLVWWRAHPVTFDHWIAPRLRSGKRRWWDYAGHRWAGLLCECDLTRDNRMTGDTMVPRVERVRSVTPSIDVLRVKLVRGQDLRTWTDRAEGLAEALCAHRVAVAKAKPGRLTVVVERSNPFSRPLPAPDIPATPQEVDLAALDIGDDEFGEPMTVSVTGGSHLLGVGATGTGKGSLLAGLLRQMGPAIRDGWVRVRVIDLKGGTETEITKDLYYRRATTVEQAIALLREARDEMKSDQQRLRGQQLRRASMGPGWPHDLIIIDEIAMLTAYADRRSVREALDLLAEIMTQGRNTLWNVIAFIQEPGKDNLEVRELFTARICLGVTAASHVDMALGEGARDRGALADEIPLDEEHAGIGFRMDKGTRLPRRLRLGFTTDEELAELNQQCAPPRAHLSVVTGGRTTGSEVTVPPEWFDNPGETGEIEQIDDDDPAVREYPAVTTRKGGT